MTLKVAHVITGLDTGGAETSLYRLLYGLRSRDVQSTLYSLGGPGVYGSRIAALGVKVRCLGMRPAAPNPMKILQLASWLRGDRANVVQTWMYHADLVGGIAARLADDIPVVWCVRHGDPASTKTRTMLIAWSCALVFKLAADKHRVLLERLPSPRHRSLGLFHRQKDAS